MSVCVSDETVVASTEKVVHKIFTIFSKKLLALFTKRCYIRSCCGMIAMKREVAVAGQSASGFPWSECQVQKTDDKSLYRI